MRRWWSERAFPIQTFTFVPEPSAAIMVLLGLMVSLNAFAVWLRKKLEIRW